MGWGWKSMRETGGEEPSQASSYCNDIHFPDHTSFWGQGAYLFGVSIRYLSSNKVFLFIPLLMHYSEKAMVPHSSTLAWKIPWTEEPGRLQSMGLLRVGHDWATSLSLFTFTHWRRKWQPTPCSCLENPRTGEPGGLLSMGSHRVGHDWSDLAACMQVTSVVSTSLWPHGL